MCLLEMNERRVSGGTRLSETRVFGGAERIPVFILIWTKEPCEEPSLFFFSPMFRALTVICVVCVGIVIAPALVEVVYWDWIDMFAFNDG